MTFIMFLSWSATLPVLLRIAPQLRLTIPLLYAAAVSTLFRSWYLAHMALADGVLIALVSIAALSWVITAAGRIAAALCRFREKRAAVRLLAGYVRQAGAAGEHMIRI